MATTGDVQIKAAIVGFDKLNSQVKGLGYVLSKWHKHAKDVSTTTKEGSVALKFKDVDIKKAFAQLALVEEWGMLAGFAGDAHFNPAGYLCLTASGNGKPVALLTPVIKQDIKDVLSGESDGKQEHDVKTALKVAVENIVQKAIAAGASAVGGVVTGSFKQAGPNVQEVKKSVGVLDIIGKAQFKPGSLGAKQQAAYSSGHAAGGPVGGFIDEMTSAEFDALPKTAKFKLLYGGKLTKFEMSFADMETSVIAKMPAMPAAAGTVSTGGFKTFDIGLMKTAPKMPLKNAEAMYEPVAGTSPESRYYVVAIGNGINFAARHNGSSLSIRAEGKKFGNPQYKQALVNAGFDVKEGKEYASVHITCDVVMASKALCAIVGRCNAAGMDISSPLPNLTVIAGK